MDKAANTYLIENGNRLNVQQSRVEWILQEEKISVEYLKIRWQYNTESTAGTQLITTAVDRMKRKTYV